jgi:mannitol-specific phosphotransferase system IIBC component
MEFHHSMRLGTAAGTILSIVPNIMSTDILRTVILAALGAIVSFVVSLMLKILFKKYSKRV